MNHEEFEQFVLKYGMDILRFCRMSTGSTEDGNELYRCGPFVDENIYLGTGIGACFLYRRRVLDDIGEYDPNKFCVEDYDYWIRLYERYGRIGHIDEYLYTYRIQGNSLTATRNKTIRQRTADLLWEHADFIFSKFANNRDYLWKFYLRMIANSGQTQWERFYGNFPEIRQNETPHNHLSFIVYGAGGFGADAHRLLGERCEFFADSDQTKWGTKIDGLTVLSPEETVRRKDDYNIMIAVSAEKILDIIHTLQDLGVERYSLYQTYLFGMADMDADYQDEEGE